MSTRGGKYGHLKSTLNNVQYTYLGRSQVKGQRQVLATSCLLVSWNLAYATRLLILLVYMSCRDAQVSVD